jgi:hypothetical protein
LWCISRLRYLLRFGLAGPGRLAGHRFSLKRLFVYDCGLNRLHLGTRFFGWRRSRRDGRSGRFRRLYWWQAKQSRINAKRLGSLRPRLSGIGADKEDRKTVAQEQRDWFAPGRKIHPEISIKDAAARVVSMARRPAGRVVKSTHFST